ncbi:E3 ubiquitin-protein ligase RNF25 isoform X2 [Hypomesus transpacificus]|uniref:E3 ubiquitin-protein ligase RNF25 isoform X2 n=1 Tax=Hypomesus transpacificus TaxID=137520 RepID=UPI001F071B56|nr:E3 ubiquitin-protein ligase RNF25 isoform X2 [Hypomesus transpacificus]
MAAKSDVLSEIEVLQSIYLEELQVIKRDDGGWEVSLVLYPSTAEDSLSQFVRLTLTLSLDSQYPSSPPCISIHYPRGLSDDKLRSVQNCLQTEAESCLGSPVLYQLIEKAKEILTESNIPHGNCVICLYGFKEGEAFTKTSCYHYFHSYCLGRYITYSENELREREKELEEDKSREKLDEMEGAILGAEFRKKWREYQTLLERQRAKGGIIDTEAESNRFLIHINEPDTSDSTEVDVTLSQSLPSHPAAFPNQISATQDQQHSGQSHRRSGPGHRRRGQSKGFRRAGGGRPHNWIPTPPTEHLEKLTLSSVEHDHFQNFSAYCSDAPTKVKLQGSPSHQKPGNSQLTHPVKAEGEGYVVLSQQGVPESGNGHSGSKLSLDDSKTDGQRGAQNSERGRGKRWGPLSGQQPGQWQERRCRGTDQWDAPEGLYHHPWAGRGERSRGRVNSPRSREGRARRGNERVFYQKVMEGEVGRKGVL